MRPQTVSDEEILSVAREVFWKHGSQASVDLVAKRLGLSPPAIFKRFGTKRNLLLESIRPPKVLPWKSVVDVLPDERSFEEQLRSVAGTMALFLKEITPMVKVIMTSDISPKEIFENHEQPLLVQAITALTEWLARCHEKGLIRKTNFRLAAMSLMGMFQQENISAMFSGEIPSQTQSHEEFLDEVTSLVWQGLKNDS